jgi:hypothetical protein
MTPLFKVFRFASYMKRETVAIFFDHQAAADFVSAHGREYGPNGCYINAFYPKRNPA